MTLWKWAARLPEYYAALGIVPTTVNVQYLVLRCQNCRQYHFTHYKKCIFSIVVPELQARFSFLPNLSAWQTIAFCESDIR
jgi:hypothetical protein